MQVLRMCRVLLGFGVAAERAMHSMADRTAKEVLVRDHLISRITSEIPYVKLNGHPKKRLPNNVNVSFQFRGRRVLRF